MKVFVLMHSVHEQYEYGSDVIKGVFWTWDRAFEEVRKAVPDPDPEANQWDDPVNTDRFTDMFFHIETHECVG